MLKPCFLNEKYLVSDEGYVLNMKGTDKLHGSLNPRGYRIVQIRVGNKSIGVSEHILVARAFCEGYAKGLQVNHKNGIRDDNRAENLEWVTPLENVHHSMEVLGHDKVGIKNVNAKKVYGYDKKTKELVYEFPCVMDACKFLKPNGTYNQLRHMQNQISLVANGHKNKKSYLGVVWSYDKDKTIDNKSYTYIDYADTKLRVMSKGSVVFNEISYGDLSLYLQKEFCLNKYRANDYINRCLRGNRKSYRGLTIEQIA